MTKHVAAAVLSLVLAIPATGMTAGIGPDSDATVRVTHLEGTAQTFAAGAKRGRPIQKGDRLGKDHEIRVGDASRLELFFPDGTVMRFSERSTVKLNEINFSRKDSEKTFSLGIDIGKLWASVKKLVTPGSRIEVRTSNAVAGVRGTTYRMNVSGDKSALIRVYEGSVYVNGLPGAAARMPAGGAPVPVPGPHEVPPPYHEVTLEEWHVIVQSFQQITVSPEGRPSEPTEFTQQQDADDWVRWNQERDRQLSF